MLEWRLNQEWRRIGADTVVETLQNIVDNLKQKGGVKFHYYEEAGGRVKIQDRDLIFQKVFYFPFGSPYFCFTKCRPAKVHKNHSM